jgi:hypothetical protein
VGRTRAVRRATRAGRAAEEIEIEVARPAV